MDRIKLAIDTLGGDNGAEPMVVAVKAAFEKYDDFDITLYGKEGELKDLINKYGLDETRVRVVGATETITCHDAPVDAVRRKKDSSMVLALTSVKNGENQAVISAGNTGALLAGGTFIVGRAKGVKRAPLATLVPTRTGDCLMLDCGANVDVKPEALVQFAKMGSIYMESIMGVKKPKVALVNIGAEDEKGNELVKQTLPVLRQLKDINFVGSIESRDIVSGQADVIVCEAFTGNCMLKLYEGVGRMFMSEIKGVLNQSPKTKLGAALIYKPLKKHLKRFMADDKGGAPLLGIKGLVVKIHGNSKNAEAESAIYQCRNFIISGVNEKIVKSFEQV